MYRHILVPLLSAERAFDAVGRALALARPLGARVTFFHPIEDGDAPGDGELQLLPLSAPELRDTLRTGRARELLARAEAGARALGVPSDARWARGRAAAAATVGAAHALGCDVLFMAPQAGKGEAEGVGSLTLAVLASAGLPVLVAPAAPPQPEHAALRVIRDEHRAIASVIHACTSLLAGARAAGTPADVEALRAALACLRSGPLAQHHANEERHLFPRVRTRCPELGPDCDELQRQHARDTLLLEELTTRLVLLEDAAPGVQHREAARALEEAVERFAEMHWEHMGREEAVVLPTAREVLQAQDWDALDQVFVHPTGGGASSDFRRLLARIH